MENELPRKAKTHKGKLHLQSFLPKVNEEPKQSLIINTKNSSEIMRMVLNDLHLLRKDYSKKLNQKEEIQNMTNNRTDIEYLCNKNNSQFFVFSNDIKKRPMNLIMGLLFNKQILDYFQFEVTNFIPISYFENSNIQVDSYMKPIIIFQGEVFESEVKYERLKNFFLDYFKLYDTEETIITNLKRIIVITCDNKTDNIVKIRNYQIDGKIEENNLDNLKWEEIGPSLDLKEKVFELAENDLYAKSLKKPKELLENKVKNIETNLLGEKRGRIHMAKQNLDAMALKKYKKLGKKEKFNKKNNKNSDSKNIDLQEK